MLTATLMAACSSEDNTETESQKGMTLYATVAETRATMDDDKGKWTFAFAANDVVNVGNDAVSGYYKFTNNGTNFTSSDAKTTSEPASWYAYFPGNEVSLANQTGDFSNVANYYALSGSTSATTTGIEGLSIHMTPQVAVLRIVKTNKSDECDINVKMGDNWVSSLTAKTNEVGFNVTTSTSKVSLLSKKTEPIKWVQLWAGGPKFAEKNVEQKMKWKEAAKNTGDNYVWGKNWKTPTKEEMSGFIKNEHKVNTDNVKAVYTQKNGVYGIEFTGVQPGYTKSTLFFPSDGQNPEYDYGTYLTSSNGQEGYGLGSGFMYSNQELHFYTTDLIHYETDYNVRPVLAN